MIVSSNRRVGYFVVKVVIVSSNRRADYFVVKVVIVSSNRRADYFVVKVVIVSSNRRADYFVVKVIDKSRILCTEILLTRILNLTFVQACLKENVPGKFKKSAEITRIQVLVPD